MADRLIYRISRLQFLTECLFEIFDRCDAVPRCPCRHDMEMDVALRPPGKGIEVQRLFEIRRFIVGKKPLAPDLRQKLDARAADQLFKRDREVPCFRLIGAGKTPVHRFPRLIHLDMDDIDGHRTLPDRCPQHLQVDLVLHGFPLTARTKKACINSFYYTCLHRKKKTKKIPRLRSG